MNVEDWDLLLHVFMTHKDIQPFLKRAKLEYTILKGRNGLVGNYVAKKLTREDFLRLMMTLVEKSGRKEVLDKELEALASFLEGKHDVRYPRYPSA